MFQKLLCDERSEEQSCFLFRFNRRTKRTMMLLEKLLRACEQKFFLFLLLLFFFFRKRKEVSEKLSELARKVFPFSFLCFFLFFFFRKRKERSRERANLELIYELQIGERAPRARETHARLGSAQLRCLQPASSQLRCLAERPGDDLAVRL